MVKAIVNPPAPDRRYIQRMGWKGVNVINGVAPTGQFPKAVGGGIFGLEGQDSGVFDGPMVPNSGTGIFYNDYAKDTTETAQRDLEWQLLRRPGRPLYPGSSSRGIVLIGPSMGTDDSVIGSRDGEILAEMQARQAAERAEAARLEHERRMRNYKIVGGVAALGAAYFVLRKMLKPAQEGM